MTYILHEQITYINCPILLWELKTNSTSFSLTTEPLSRNPSTIKRLTQRMQHHTLLLSASDRDQRLRPVDAMLLVRWDQPGKSDGSPASCSGSKSCIVLPSRAANDAALFTFTEMVTLMSEEIQESDPEAPPHRIRA